MVRTQRHFIKRSAVIDTLMAHVYESRKDADGFLYITYTDETTLGVIQEEEE